MAYRDFLNKKYGIAQDFTSLKDHDDRYHDGDYKKDTQTCKLRKRLDKEDDEIDNLTGAEKEMADKIELEEEAELVAAELRDVTASEYAEVIASAKKNCPSDIQWRVDAKSAEDYGHSKARIATKKGSCICVMDNGDIVSLCRPSGEKKFLRGHHLMAEAVKAGGDRLDTFDGNWKTYIHNGFTPVSWTPFNKEYAPEGWDEDRDEEESIVFFMYTGETKPIDKDEWMSQHKPFTGDDGYDEARQFRDDLIAKTKKGE